MKWAQSERKTMKIERKTRYDVVYMVWYGMVYGLWSLVFVIVCWFGRGKGVLRLYSQFVQNAWALCLAQLAGPLWVLGQLAIIHRRQLAPDNFSARLARIGTLGSRSTGELGVNPQSIFDSIILFANKIFAKTKRNETNRNVKTKRAKNQQRIR